MRPIRPPARRTTPRARRSPALAAALTVVVALTATACGPGSGDADAKASASAAQDAPGGTEIKIPQDVQEKLKKHGIDLDKWENGEWKNWDRDKWLRQAGEFINPIIKDFWDPDKIEKVKPPQDPSKPEDISEDQGKTDPEPAAVPAQPVQTPYTSTTPGVGLLLFSTPEGESRCSATVVKDPAHPGKSNLVWTAAHCVHAGKNGGWYRNMMFVPNFNRNGASAAEMKTAPFEDRVPAGKWWADDMATSSEWIKDGGAVPGVPMAPYDFALMHVKPEEGTSGKSLEEMAGGAYSVNFNAPAMSKIPSLTAQGYPAEAPFDGALQEQCTDKPTRLSMDAVKPTMYRIGCTMTGGSSGGPWFAKGADGEPELISNMSMGPRPARWSAGPHLGPEARNMFHAMSKRWAAKG
ncbi:trypsin-like serine peptidase [Streptomyces sp. NPDC059080]|uniref:trypsin-like serine peptidase n=1 Tax=Streptomyces sp. NPDC059080 TaxID=3346718 RepID=UPI0036AB95A9